jgi:hypothetical protein
VNQPRKQKTERGQRKLNMLRSLGGWMRDGRAFSSQAKSLGGSENAIKKGLEHVT